MRVPAVVALVALASGCAPSLPRLRPVALATPQRAVEYVEYQVGGSRGTRRLPTQGNAFYGVDYKSRIAIEVDEAALRAALARPNASPAEARQAEALTARIAAMQGAVAGVEAVHAGAREAAAAYSRARTPAELDRAFAHIGEVSRAVEELLDPLERVVRARFDAQGLAGAEEAERLLDGVVGGGAQGVNWAALGELLRSELALLSEAQAAAGPGVTLQMEIRAHRVTRDVTALPVQNYNTVAVGTVEYPSRLSFEISEEQLRVHQANMELAARIAAANDGADALFLAIRTDFERGRGPLQDAVADARTAVQGGRAALGSLRTWDRAALTAWLGERSASLTPALRAQLDSAVTGLAGSYRALEEFAALPAELRSMPADRAMETLLGRARQMQSLADTGALRRALRGDAWTAHRDALQALKTELQRLPNDARERLVAPPSPIAELDAAIAAAGGIATALQRVRPEAVALLREILLLPITRDLGELPTPAGQRRLDLASNLDGAIELAGNAVDVRDGDRIRVEYRFFEGDQPLPGVGWTDEFVVRQFGLRSNVIASLAFIQQDHDARWRPTPSLNWTMSYEPWPTSTGSGVRPSLLARSGVGLGVSTMSLDFSDEHDIELGLGLTATFLDGRLLGGYGWNLQRPGDDDDFHQGFWFFSVRLFSASGSLGS